MTINIFSDYPLSWKPSKKRLKRPIYKALVKQMKKDIDNGTLLPGTKLPPQRELAYFLDVHFTTITKVYRLSQQMGLTYGIVGNGTFIAESVNTPQTITTDKIKNVKELGFISSFESSNQFLRSTITSVAKQKNVVYLLNNSEPTGLSKHKLIATKYLSKTGMNVNLQNTLIVSGGNNALTIALIGLFKIGDKIAVDQFTYANFIELARLKGLNLVPIASDNEGMRTDLLELACQNNDIKGIYLMPDCNNPTTTIIYNDRRQALANIIKREGVILIEDDYLNAFNLFKLKPRMRLSNLVPEQSFYICSVSKTLVSGIGVAFIRVADQFKRQVELTMFNINSKSSSVDADIVTKSLENGTAYKILQYKIDRTIKANQIFDSIFYPNLETKNRIMLFRCLPLANNLKGEKIEKICLEKQIKVFHSDRFLVGPHPNKNFLRISIGAIEDPLELEGALLQLKKILLYSLS